MQNSEFSKPLRPKSRIAKAENRASDRDKSELLYDLDSAHRREENLSVQNLLWVYIVLFLFLLFLLPKIYIANQIYYISKDINTKYHKYTALIEENRYLKKEIEHLNYQMQVVNDVEIP